MGIGVEMNLGRAHKTRFWYLFGCSRNFPTSTPVTFMGNTNNKLNCLSFNRPPGGTTSSHRRSKGGKDGDNW